MTTVSKRIEKIASFVGPGESVADIGSDHGHLPIYLRENGISSRVVATDLRKGPIGITEKNLSHSAGGRNGDPFKFDCAKAVGDNGDGELFKIDYRLGDGLTVLSEGEVETVVIAGMGGQTIVSILSENEAKACSFHKYIFQPRSHSDELRKWLKAKGWFLLADGLAEEGGRICEVIAATPDPSKMRDRAMAGKAVPCSGESEAAMEAGVSSVMLRDRPPLLGEYIRKKMLAQQKIQLAVSDTNTAEAERARILAIKKEVAYMLLLAEIEAGQAVSEDESQGSPSKPR
ncbi:MAG: class I SAM-dependent methyltransferase [Clostridiales Family XIII bacterium]|jgi:tRNA (adenine22-N1)-methyltransferase|nr:class I SAM-dependent methyltransferase [Clostridiales Family XIII bacterium]